MADNTELDAGTGGDTIATDDIGGVKHQRVKVQFGADGSATDVSATDPLPIEGEVTGPLTDTELRADPVPIEAAALPLPSGAATSAKQDTAQTALDAIKTAVEILDNTVAGTELQVDVLTSALPSGASTGAKQDTQTTALQAIQAAVEILDNAVAGNEFQVDVLTIAAGDNNIGNVDVASSALPTGAATAANQTTAIGHLDGVETALTAIQTAVEILDNVVSGAEAQVDIVSSALPTGASTAANQSTANTALSAIQTAVELLDDAIKTDDVAFTPATHKVMATGMLADSTSTDSVDEGDIGIPRMTLDRKQFVTISPTSENSGLDVFRSIDLDETEEEVKASAGKVYGWFFFNAHSATLYVKLYNATTANTTVGTTTPRMTIPVPAGQGANVEFTNGITFDTAISAATTTGVADNDTGAPAANVLQANILYK